MLNKVEATTDQGVTLSLPLDDISGGFSIEDIQGLDPVPANVVSSSFASLDGEQYQSSRREKRNIVVKLGLQPDYTTMTVRQLRNQLYGYFMPKKNTLLTFYDDELGDVNISGLIETFDCPLFTKEPVATISILCFDPDFYDPTPIDLPGNTTSTNVPTAIMYDGNVDTGMLFTLSANRPMDGFIINCQADGDQVRQMQFTASILSGDVINISTVPGNKYATLTRGGVISSILYGVSPYADWPRLQPGGNTFWVQATGAAVPYNIEYNDKFGGL